MVQFIPQANGAQSFPQRGPNVAEILAQIQQGMALRSQFKDAQMQSQMNNPAWKFLGMPQPSAPLQPGAQGPVAPPNPLGPIANAPMSHIANTPTPVLSSILGAQNSQTLYYNPVTKTASLTPEDGAIPIGGFKGPTALQGMNTTNMNAWRQQYDMKRLELQQKLQKLQESTSLSPEQKIQLALISGQSRILGNPLVDLPEPEYKAMLDHMQTQMADLEKQTGVTAPAAQAGAPAAPAPGTTPPSAGTKGATEVERKVGNKIAIFDSKTKKFLRWK